MATISLQAIAATIPLAVNRETIPSVVLMAMIGCRVIKVMIFKKVATGMISCVASRLPMVLERERGRRGEGERI